MIESKLRKRTKEPGCGCGQSKSTIMEEYRASQTNIKPWQSLFKLLLGSVRRGEAQISHIDYMVSRGMAKFGWPLATPFFWEKEL